MPFFSCPPRVRLGLCFTRLVAAIALGSVLGGTASASAILERRFVGQQYYNTANIAVCQPASPSDFRIDGVVPGGWSGTFHFDWTLYRNGQQVGFYEQTVSAPLGLNYVSFQHVFSVTTEVGSYSASFVVRKRKLTFSGFNYDTIVLDDNATPIVVSAVEPTPSFKILNSSNVFVDPPPDGSPIPVSLSTGIVMNAAATTCETAYAVIVQESNQWWSRTMQHEWWKWFSGQAPANLDLQQLTTSYSASDGTGYFSLLGGNFTSSSPIAFNGQPRFYRVGLAPGGGGWNPKMALIQVNW
jgi:hypothetical protein